MKKILFFPQMRVINANAKSSYCTIGVPGVPSWCGFMHALERQLKQNGYSISLKKIAVISHKIKLHTYRGDNRYESSIINTANPPKKDGSPSSFIVEARCNLTLSILIEYENYSEIEKESLSIIIDRLVMGRLKFAGGDIITNKPSELLDIDDDLKEKKLLNRLMPGYCLVERNELMKEAMTDNQDALDILLDHLKTTYQCTQINEEIHWYGTRKTKGWIVPISVGYHGVTGINHAKNQRDYQIPHLFAESIITLGEYVMSYRIPSLDRILWHFHVDLEKSLYLCTQTFNQTKES
jgi:CRISPR-associated protein Csy2